MGEHTSPIPPKLARLSWLQEWTQRWKRAPRSKDDLVKALLPHQDLLGQGQAGGAERLNVQGQNITLLSEGSTTGVQYEISPLGKISCAAIQQTTGLVSWLSGINEGSRQALYRRCTNNLRLEAKHGFEKTAVQLGRPDYCAQERALLARDLVQEQP